MPQRPASAKAQPGSHPIAQAERGEAIERHLKAIPPTTFDFALACSRILPVEGLAEWLLEAPPGQQYRLGWLLLESYPDEVERERYTENLHEGQLAVAIQQMREQSGSVVSEHAVLQHAFLGHVNIVRDYVRRLIQHQLEDGLFITANKRLGYGLETAYRQGRSGRPRGSVRDCGHLPHGTIRL